MKPHARTITAALFAVATAATAAATMGTVASAAPTVPVAHSTKTIPAPTVVNVVETEFRIKLSQSTVPAGKVTFNTANDGKAPHELVVLRTPRDAAKLGHGIKIPEHGWVGELGNLHAGVDHTLTVKLAPGHYALICNLKGHYAAGMYANFTVR